MKYFALCIGLLSAALFGAATPLSKALLDSLNPLQLAGLLYLGAAAGLAPFIVPKKSAPVKISRSNISFIAGAVVFGGILGPVFLLWGLTLASSASVSLWLNLELFATALLGHFFFRDQMGRNAWFAVIAGFSAGALLVFNEPGSGVLAGILVALACFCWGLDNHCTALIDGIGPSQSTFIKGLVAGTVNFTFGCLMVGSLPSGTTILSALAVGAFSYGMSIVLYISAAQLIGAVRSQILFSSSPFWGLAFSMLFLHEALTVLQIAAFFLLVCSIVLIMTENHEHVHEHGAQEHIHLHRHDDAHHVHAHGDEPLSLAHTHLHVHEEMAHNHKHLPDIHHRHSHVHQGTS